MRAVLMGNVDISDLEEFTGARKGIIYPVPLAELLKFPWPMIRKFMHVYGLYSFPTEELIDYLAKLIEGKDAIEIGCGLGIIGRALGIPFTDSKFQEASLIRLYFHLLGQPVIQYPADVEKLEALEAVDKYHPDIVLGSYITHKWRDDTQSGNYWGVDTIKLINSVNEYYMIGNLGEHLDDDPAMKYLDGYEQHDFLVTRSDPEKNALFRWRKPHSQEHYSK